VYWIRRHLLSDDWFSEHVASGKTSRSRPLHLLLDAMSKLFDLPSLLDHIKRQNVFIGLVDVLLQFVGQLH
jgi:hypothetical protein